MNMKHLGKEYGKPEVAGNGVYYPSMSVRGSQFPEIAKMKDGEEGHVTMRFRKMGSRLQEDRSDSDIDLQMTHMGYEDINDNQDDDFTDRIGYSHHNNYRHRRMGE